MMSMNDHGKEAVLRIDESQDAIVDFRPDVTPTSSDKNEVAQPVPLYSINVTNQKGGEPPSDAHAKSGTPEFAIEVRQFRRILEPVRDSGWELDKHLNLRVPKGVIFGLITYEDPFRLLEYFAGVGPWQPSWIRVLGQVPGTPGASIPGPVVGYVSHQFPLYREHTVGEILRFVGKLHGMTKPLIKQRIAALEKFLVLPQETLSVKRLSHEDSHLVSIAASLIHSPPIFILEETSHFLSPLTRCRIWNLLRMLSREEGVTVLITSSNIEELRQADLVAVMAGTRVLKQDSPQRLLKKFHCQTLQKVARELYAEDNEEGKGKHNIRRKKAGVVREYLVECLGHDEKIAVPSETPELLEPAAAPAPALSRSKGIMKGCGYALNTLNRISVISKLFLPRTGIDCALMALLAACFASPVVIILDLFDSTTYDDEKGILEGEYELSAAEYIMPGVIFSWIFVMTMLLTIFNRRYRDFTADRCLLAGMRPYEIAASSMIAQFCVMLLPTVLILAPILTQNLTEIRSLQSFRPESVTLVSILCLLQAFQGTMFGMLVTIRWMPSWVTFFFSFCGCAMNIFANRSLKPWRNFFVVIAGYLLPQSFPVEAFRGIIHRGWGFGNDGVWIGLSFSIAWSTCLACCVIVFTAASFRVRLCA